MTQKADYYAACCVAEIDDIKDWLKERGQEAHKRGESHGLRATHLPDFGGMMILEGWKEPMKEYPEPHLHVTYANG